MARVGEDGKEIRRTKGDGGLFQRADGMWIGRIELPPDADGKRRRKQVSSKDFAAASVELRKLRNAVDEGRIAYTANTTVGKWLETWITDIHPRRQVRPTTLDDYDAIIRNHIKPAIGAKRLDKLAPKDVRAMHNKIGPRRTAVVAHVVLQKALDDAIREQLITKNVAKLVDKPRYKKQKRTSFAVEVVHRILGTALASRDKSEATRWAAAFLTGARQSELLGLRWSYVDLDNGVMDLSWQLQQLKQVHGCNGDCGRQRPGWCPQAKWKLPPDFEYEECHRSMLWTRPKSEAGERYIRIISPLLVSLRELHREQGENPHGLVWHYKDGRPIGPREDSRRWQTLLRDAKIIGEKQTLPLHLARHSAATVLRAHGVDEQTRMEILGHATVDSQRIYAHADAERHLAAMSHLAQLLPTSS